VLEAVLLAAGAGRRLGQPKALLELRGVWILPRLVAALAVAGARCVHVVVRAEEEALIRQRGLPAAARLIVNPDPGRGRGSSLQAGLTQVPEGCALFIHPCDVPLLSAAAAATLVAGWMEQKDAANLAARPVTPSGRGGHPLLLGSARVAEARRLGEDGSLRDLLHADPRRRLDVVLRGDPGPFLDVDTPEQLALLESLLPPA
jgi:nicotine blue oxidoreductase